jgi:ABC-2 type transport system ATP-binding protein
VVDHGKVIALGTPAELIGSLHASSVVEFECDPPLDDAMLQALPGVTECRPHGAARVLAVHSLAESVPPLLVAVEHAGARLVTLHTHRATLEDVFVSLTGRDLRDA